MFVFVEYAISATYTLTRRPIGIEMSRVWLFVKSYLYENL